MKKLLKANSITIFFLLISFISFGQLPTLSWANNHFGGSGYSITSDNNGNIYQAGFRQDDEYSFPYSFFSKYNKNGNIIWQKIISNITNTSLNYGNVLKLDSFGNIFLIGSFSGTCDFDPSISTNLVSSSDNITNTYIAKFTNNGELNWVKTFTGGYYNSPADAQIDANNNIIITGSFSGTTDFDPSNSISNQVSQNNNSDVYVCKLNNNGEYIWAKGFGGSETDNGTSVTLDNTGNIYLAGSFSLWADFDSQLGPNGYLQTNGFADAYICKFDANGNYIWTKNLGGAGYDTATSIVCNANGDVFISGGFYGTADFDSNYPATFFLNSNGNFDAFLASLNSNGDLLWAKSFGGIGYEGTNSIAIKGNYLYCVGIFYDECNFSVGSNLPNLTNSNNQKSEIFIVKMDLSGNYIFSKSIGGSGDDVLNKIYIDNLENIIVTGEFNDNGDFKTGAKKVALTRTSILEKFSQSSAPLPIVLISLEGIPQTHYNQITWATTSETNNDYFLLQKSEDGKKWIEISKIKGAVNSTEAKKYNYDDYAISSLSNYYRLKQIDIDGKITYSKIININNTNFENKGLHIFPNPTNGIITVENPLQNTVLELFDTNGKKVKSAVSNSFSSQINLNGLPSGTYFLSNKTNVKKVILE